MVAWEQNRTEYNSINPHIILRKIRCILYSNLVLSNHTARIYPSFVVLKHFISKLFCLIWYYILLIWYNQLNSCIFVFYQSNVETKWCCAHYYYYSIMISVGRTHWMMLFNIRRTDFVCSEWSSYPIADRRYNHLVSKSM